VLSNIYFVAYWIFDVVVVQGHDSKGCDSKGKRMIELTFTDDNGN
jgi:hypothetical protein